MAFFRELRQALLQWRNSLGFAATVVITLALGIAATTLIFSLVEGVLLRPLPFRDSQQLVVLGDHLRDGFNTPVTAREIALYSAATTAFSSMGSWVEETYELSGGDVPEATHGARLSASAFSTLGVGPYVGRVFNEQEDHDSTPVVVISYSMWTARYHRDPQIAGQTVVLNRRPYTIIGVMPRDFEFPLTAGRLDQAQLWVPMSFTPEELGEGATGFWGYHIVARLKPGVTTVQAAQDADRVAQQIMRGFPASMTAIHIRGDATPLLDSVVEESQKPLRTLFMAVCVVLFIVCLNVAVLFLVRAVRRRREYAVRIALGARARAIVWQSVCEGLILSLLGGVLGLVIAYAALPAIVRLVPDSLPRLDSIAIDGRVAGFALVLGIVTGVLSSLTPAFAALRVNLLDGLKDGTVSVTGSHSWLRATLVVTEIAVAMVLLTASAALLKSYQKMLAVDPGFRPERLLVGSYQLPQQQYATDDKVEAFNRSMLERLQSTPGISAASISTAVPATGSYGLATYTVEGRPASEWKLAFAEFTMTYGDYFRVLGTPVIEGRSFADADRADKQLVVIVNQTLAKRWWPGQSPIGKRLHIGNPQKPLPWATVIGVVADTKIGSRDEPTGEQMYFPALQPASLHGTAATDPVTYPTGGFIAVRSQLPPEQLVDTLRKAVATVDPQLALEQVRTMQEAIADVETPRRFNTSLISIFAAAALLLAAMGLYAVVAFSASLRRREIAIRMALGAQRTSVARLVLRWGVQIALLGCAAGVLGSLALSRILRSFLFDVSATNVSVYAASVGVMLMLAGLASALPALRAASHEPVKLLREL